MRKFVKLKWCLALRLRPFTTFNFYPANIIMDCVYLSQELLIVNDIWVKQDIFQKS